MIVEVSKISIFLIPFFLVLGFLIYQSYQKLKANNHKRLNLICSEIALEEKIAHQLKNAPQEIEKIDNFIKHKLVKMKVTIFNVDFSLSEIFN